MWAHKKLIAGSVLILLAVGVFIWSKMSQSPAQIALTTTNGSGVTQTTTVVNPGTTLAFIRKANGTVEIKNTTQTTPAVANAGLNVGDSVVTKGNSDAEIVFTDNSIIRLAMNSTLTIAASNSTSTDLELTEGSLWARILKPLGDRSLFTIKTKDLSAGVRSTSVRMTKTEKQTSVDVIDSYSGTGQTAVEIQYEEQAQKKQEDMNIEEHFEFPYTGQTPKKKLDLAKVFEEDAMVRVNTKEDLLYMNELALKLEKSNQADEQEKARLLKVQGEIKQSLPKPNEIKPFFDSRAIEEHVIGLESTKPVEPNTPDTTTQHNDLMQSIRDDMQLVEKKTQLERERDRTAPSNPTVAEEHKKAINQLENEVRNFDVDWKTKQIELEKQAVEKKLLEEKQAAEKKALEDAQVQAIEGDRTPNLPTPPTSSGSDRKTTPVPTIPTPTIKSTTPITAPLPKPVEPIVQPTTTTPPTTKPIIPLPRPVLSGSATIKN